jgi:cytochrome c oxidase subunit 2
MDFLIESASSFSGEADLVIWIITILTGFWLIVAEVVLFAFIFKFRKRPGVNGQYVSGEKPEEMKWIHLPHNLILLCDVVILVFAVRLWYNVKQDLPPADETIQVIGHQWSWRFVHPGLDKKIGTEDDVETVGELRVKVGKTYHFKLEAADVLHSFSIPTYRLKQDAIPGRVITGWFKPTKLGEFDIQCAENCGIGHGAMKARLFVETESEHVKWLVKKTESNI